MRNNGITELNTCQYSKFIVVTEVALASSNAQVCAARSPIPALQAYLNLIKFKGCEMNLDASHQALKILYYLTGLLKRTMQLIVLLNLRLAGRATTHFNHTTGWV